MAQTTMRSEIGKISLEKTFSERESINESIVREIDKASDPWGVKVLRYEIKQNFFFENRLGGVTGDVLGASTEIAEVLTLVLLLALY